MTDSKRPGRETEENRMGSAPEPPARAESAELSFESCLDRLENIVKELERGDQPLERALTLFEEGMKLSANCRRKLEEAENRVEILLKKSDGKMTTEPLRLGSNDEAQ